MKCLFVKAPFAGYIVDEVKSIEYRTRWTHVRGRIGIIESGTGTVIGDAKLIGCWKDMKHDGTFDWVLKDARRYMKPVPFKHKKGAVVWINLDIDPAMQAIAPSLSVMQLQETFQVYGKELEKFFAERRKEREG